MKALVRLFCLLAGIVQACGMRRRKLLDCFNRIAGNVGISCTGNVRSFTYLGRKSGAYPEAHRWLSSALSEFVHCDLRG